MKDENSSINRYLLRVNGNPILWKSMLGAAVLTMLLGMVAILLPVVATFTIEAIVAVVLIIAGAIHLCHAFQASHPENVFLRFIGGLLYAGFGVALLIFPLKGAITLTFILALLFMAGGVFKIINSMALKPINGWLWMLFSGFLSVILGFVIWFGLPHTAHWAIGLLVGIDLLFSGWVMTVFSLEYKKAYKDND